MGLFGALFAGVAGLGSQSNKIGIVSNNISNVNTVGFKQGAAAFSTLVVPGASTGVFSPGGVLGNNRQLVQQQGLIQATTSNTDMAISGGGLFVVNTKADGTGDTLYTRAGSFTPDSSGNFANSSGFFLQGIAVNGGVVASPNANALTTVNVNQNATGASVATSLVTVAGNFNASQLPFVGAGEKATLAGESATNSGNSLSQILVPTALPAGNGLVRGQKLDITTGTSGGAPVTDTYQYGGFSIGRNIVTGAAGDTSTDPTSTLTTDTPTSLTVDSTAKTITVPVAAGTISSYVVGQNAYVSGLSATTQGISATQLNNQELQITAVDTTNNTITFAYPSSITTGTTGTATGVTGLTVTNRSYNFKGNMLDATADNIDFLKDSSSFVSTASKTFSITVNGTSNVFSYNSVPNTSLGQFNSLNTLATAINSASNGNLTASVVNHQLYVSAVDPNQTVQFTNGDAVGAQGAAGINWVQELGLQDQLGSTDPAVHIFNSLQSLENKINATDPGNVQATVSGNSISINAVDPRVSITFADDATNSSLGGGTGAGSMLSALGFKDNTNAPLTSTIKANLTTGAISPSYDPNDPTKNMSSGNVTPQFSKDVTVYDSLGVGHTVAINVLKLSSLKWAVEITAVPASDVISQNGDGQIASGQISFDGNGAVLADTFDSNKVVQVAWNQNANSPGAAASNINFNLGDIGSTSGITQFAGSSNVSQAIQNGSPTGQLTGVTIDSNGFVTASFSNGQTQKLYQIPLASVTNPDGMETVSGNAYKNTLASGDPTLSYAGTNGTGTITASALEQSNVDLSTQLTDLIVAQQAYGANTRVLTVTSQLLQQLNQIIQ